MEEIDEFPSQEDIEDGKDILYNEIFYSIDRESLFRAGVYSILTAGEKYEDSKSTYEGLIERGVHSPEKITDMGKEELSEEIETIEGRRVTFYNQKSSRIYNFAEEWIESDIPEKILDDIENGWKNSHELRDEIVNNFTGMGPKVASFFQMKCGYKDVIPIDTWESRFLDTVAEEDLRVPNYVDVGGHTEREHSDLEEKFLDVLERFKEENLELGEDLSPALFHCALWSKHSDYDLSKS